MRTFFCLLAIFYVGMAHGEPMPVPPDIQNPATLTVAGTPGVGQGTSATTCSYVITTANSQKCLQTSLNQKTPVTPGEWAIAYEGSYIFHITVTDHEQKMITLSRVAVQRYDGTYKFQVEADLSDSQQQDNYLLYNWIGPLGYTEDQAEAATLAGLCLTNPPSDDTDKKVCTALAGSDYHGLMPFLKFDTSTATVTVNMPKVTCKEIDDTYNYRCRFVSGVEPFTYTANIIGSGADGDFISVFPGVYNIKFTNSAGQTTEVPHVHADLNSASAIPQ